VHTHSDSRVRAAPSPSAHYQRRAGGYHAVPVTKAIATHRMTLEDAQRAFELVAATMAATPGPAANECSPPVHLYPSTAETSLRNTTLTAALD